MNRDDVLKMEAGRDFDALIAENVMGWALGEPHEVHGYMFHGMKTVRDWIGSKDEKGITRIEGWSPSTDISAAWEVVEKMQKRYAWLFDGSYSNEIGKKWEVSIGRGMIGDNDYCEVTTYCESANTIPLAICRAALLAVQGE